MILVIGYGNPLCGDDGVGPHVVKRLASDARKLAGGATVEYLALRQLMPELIEPISLAQTVIFVDAAVGKTPGEVVCQEISCSTRHNGTASGAFTHYANPTMLLGTAESLYGRRPTAYLYTMTGHNFDLGSPFSCAVETALERLLYELKTRIALCTNSASQKP